MTTTPESQYYRAQLNIYSEYLKQIGYSEGTQARYSGNLKFFFIWLEQHGIRHALQVREEHITSFRSHEEERPNKNYPGTPSLAHIQTVMLAVRTWLHYLQQTGYIKKNPMSAIHIGSTRHEPRDILTIAEIKELYGACRSLRERAVLSLFYGCGLRIAEAEKINIKDVHFKSGLLYVREGKGKKRRVIPMSATVSRDLRDYYLHERSGYIKSNTSDNQDAFILNTRGNRMLKSALRNLIKSIIGRTTIATPITTHGLRHSIATHLIESGMSLEDVRDFLGHEFIDTTQIYTRITVKQMESL